MKRKVITYCLIMIYAVLLTTSLYANEDTIGVGIDEQLGAYLPLDAVFTTSEGDTVALADVIDKPVLLALVYYECPGICTPLQTELGWVATKVDLAPGEDFKIISISFDQDETPEIAAKWKKNFLEALDGNISDDDWLFLTGDSINIKKVTDVAGFRFKPDREEFVHAGCVITVSPKAKISRYLFGVTFNPFDVKMALIDAQAGKTNPTIAKVLQFCFSYDPDGRGYTLNVTRIAGSVMLLGLGIFIAIVVFKKKNNTDSSTGV